MTTLHEHAPLWRARRFRLVVAGLFAIVSMMGICWWWFVLKPLFDERRPFVGTWKMVSPVFDARPDLDIELDLALDGTMRDRVWNPHTGAIDYQKLRPGRWRVLDERFQHVVGGYPLPGLVETFGQSTLLMDQRVTWEGPDRFRLQGDSAGRRSSTWARADRTGSR
jgi:hypothetical protein